MRIITLNTWGGRAGKEKLLDFFRAKAKYTDVFCLQEMWSAPHTHLEGVMAGGIPINHDNIMTNGVYEISKALPDFEPLFHPHFGDNYGLMMLVKKSFTIIESGELFVYLEKGHYPTEDDIGNHARNVQYVSVETNSGLRTIMNFHGLWNGKGKGDSNERLEQSNKIFRFISDIKNPIVLCGDFNLKPDTQSLQKFEGAGLRNLIKEYGVTSTRTSYYTKPEKFADYIFTSPKLDIGKFAVLPDEISDHAPLLVEVN